MPVRAVLGGIDGGGAHVGVYRWLSLGIVGMHSLYLCCFDSWRLCFLSMLGDLSAGGWNLFGLKGGVVSVL